MAGPYATGEQVKGLIGELSLSGTIDLDALARDAQMEMDALIGERYVIPLNIDEVLSAGNLTPIAKHHRIRLELINARLAAGRTIMAQTSATEDRALWSYGKYLVDLAYHDINAVIGGTLLISGQSDADLGADAGTDVPMIFNYDEESAIDIFEDFALRGAVYAWWTPGRIVSRMQRPMPIYPP